MVVEIPWHEHGSLHEIYLQRVGEFFLMTLLEFALMSEKAIKKFCLVGGGTPLRIRSRFRKRNKKFVPCGGGGFPPLRNSWAQKESSLYYSLPSREIRNESI